jgi:MOSC domain-containing protein YiiM
MVNEIQEKKTMTTVLSLEAMEEGLARAGASPRDSGRLELIVRRPGIDVREELQTAQLSPEEGLTGDTWRSRGSKSMPDGSANPGAQITLMNSRVVQVLAQEPARWSLAGDQLFVDFDLGEENLPPGQRIAIGEVVLEISAIPHTGCAKFTARFGSDATRFVNSPEGRKERRRGVNARVIQAGTIRQGDKIKKV